MWKDGDSWAGAEEADAPRNKQLFHMCPHVLCWRPTTGPREPQQETGRGLERKWARGWAVDMAPAVSVAERRREEGQRAWQGSSHSRFVDCSWETREEMNEALDGGVKKRRPKIRRGRRGEAEARCDSGG